MDQRTNFFRTFDKTRSLTILIFEVFSDMLSFISLTVYSMIGLSLLLLFSEKETVQSIFNIIGYTYMTTIGEYQSFGKEVSSFNALSIVIFILASIINTIVMMNLLISIIGDTFDRIQQELVIRDMKLLADMIYEIENLMIWKKNIARSYFIHVILAKDQANENGFSWDGKVKEIQRSVNVAFENISKQIKDNNTEVKEMLDAIKKSNDENVIRILEAIQKSSIKNPKYVAEPST